MKVWSKDKLCATSQCEIDTRSMAQVKINSAFARFIWAGRILSYLSPTHLPPDPSTNEESQDRAADDEEADSLLDVDTLENDILSRDPCEALKNKFLTCLGVLLSHTPGRDYVTCVTLEEADGQSVVRAARNSGFSSGTDDKDTQYFRIVERFLNDVSRIGNVSSRQGLNSMFMLRQRVIPQRAPRSRLLLVIL